MCARHRDAKDMIEKFPLNLPFRERGHFLWLASVCMVVWVLWGKRNSRVFKGVKRDSREVWSLVPFHVSHWASILKVFGNYSIGMIMYSWSPFL